MFKHLNDMTEDERNRLLRDSHSLNDIQQKTVAVNAPKNDLAPADILQQSSAEKTSDKEEPQSTSLVDTASDIYNMLPTKTQGQIGKQFDKVARGARKKVGKVFGKGAMRTMKKLTPSLRKGR